MVEVFLHINVRVECTTIGVSGNKPRQSSTHPHTAAKMVQFSGMYRHDKDENLQEVLAKIGVGLVLRKVMTAAKPSIEVKAGEGEGDTWTIIITTPVKTITITFILGQETEIDTPDSGKNKVVFSLEGDTLIQRPVDASGEKAVEVVREFSDDGLTQTMHHLASGTKGSRAFKREAP